MGIKIISVIQMPSVYITDKWKGIEVFRQSSVPVRKYLPIPSESKAVYPAQAFLIYCSAFYQGCKLKYRMLVPPFSLLHQLIHLSSAFPQESRGVGTHQNNKTPCILFISTAILTSLNMLGVDVFTTVSEGEKSFADLSTSSRPILFAGASMTLTSKPFFQQPCCITEPHGIIKCPALRNSRAALLTENLPYMLIKGGFRKRTFS